MSEVTKLVWGSEADDWATYEGADHAGFRETLKAVTQLAEKFGDKTVQAEVVTLQSTQGENNG